jgi:hypothetical protein
MPSPKVKCHELAKQLQLRWFESGCFQMTIQKPITLQEAKSIPRHLGLTVRKCALATIRGRKRRRSGDGGAAPLWRAGQVSQWQDPLLGQWQRRATVWRKATSPAGGAMPLRNRTINETGIAMKRCAQCHGNLGLGVRSRKVWNGRWWVLVRYCSAHCEALHKLERYKARANRGRHAFIPTKCR